MGIIQNRLRKTSMLAISGCSKLPFAPSLDSTAETGHANGADWQEEIYQKIKVMKETYLPEINEMYQRIATKLQQHDPLPQQPKSEQLEFDYQAWPAM
ncbi:mediator of RNA polymerase II transcription subunit 15a-like [Populus alba x Populus x berolinensis]|nr:mediator of RNA polymerase II transcription subunit 15a-like [Populus alba x Populus x berolinensis]